MRRALFLALTVLVSAPTFGQTAPPPPGEGQNVIVTGQRIQDYRDALALCLARNCPPNEDADATLALAEALMLDGEYHEGRDTVQASLRRNRDQARGYPEPVSDLYRAHGRLSRHLGYDADGRRSTYGILGALREGIPQEDHRHFTARFEIIDLLSRNSQFNLARRELRELVRIARRAGREDVATIAELRALLIDDIISPQGPARPQLLRMSRLTAPEDRMRATGARILLARIYRSEGQAERADALIADIARSSRSATSRRLLYSPEYRLQVQGVGELIAGGIPDNFEDKWIDVGFWVTPEGRVTGLELLRNRSNADWAEPLIRSIRDRRYTEAPDATYRMERYTYTSGWTRATRTRLPVRSDRARVEYLDLTTDEAPESVRRAAGGRSN